MADADDDWSGLEAQNEWHERHERHDASQGSDSTPSPPSRGARTPRKRRSRRKNDDFESQQSILKWVRQVPGPLQDVMKKQVDQLEGDQTSRVLSEFASGNSDRYSIPISTVFDDGAWVDMCSYLGMETSPGTVYGGIKMSRLKYPVTHILDDDKSPPKIPKLLLLIKTARYVDEEIVAVLHDPTGEIDGYFHREIVEQIGPALIEGAGILLRNVSIFEPMSRGESYLNIIPHNLQRVFLPNSHAVSAYEAAVELFNAAREQDPEQEVAEERESESDLPQHTHDTVRHTSTELSYLSQRQVVHRHPPVNSTAASIMSGKNSNADGEDEELGATGLGRWEWSKLVQQTGASVAVTPGSSEGGNEATARKEEMEASRPLVSASRFARLLASKRRRSSSGHDNEDQGGSSDGPPQPESKKRSSSKVTFAVDVVTSPLRIAERSPTEGEHASGTTLSRVPPPSSAAKPPARSATIDVQDEEEDDEEDDEDW